jgi:cytidylate kinase
MNISAVDKHVSAQFKFWQHQKHTVTIPGKKSLRRFITISREYGCFGYEIAQETIRLLNGGDKAPTPPWAAYERQVLDRVMEDMGLSSHLARTLTDDAQKVMTDILTNAFSKLPPQVAVYQKLAETIRLLAANGNVVIVGRASNVITRGMYGGFHVMVVAPMEYKVDNVMKFKKIQKKEAEKLIIENTARRVNYIKEYVEFDVTDPHHYDMVINLAHTTKQGAARLIIEGMNLKISY